MATLQISNLSIRMIINFFISPSYVPNKKMNKASLILPLLRVTHTPLVYSKTYSTGIKIFPDQTPQIYSFASAPNDPSSRSIFLPSRKNIHRHQPGYSRYQTKIPLNPRRRRRQHPAGRSNPSSLHFKAARSG